MLDLVRKSDDGGLGFEIPGESFGIGDPVIGGGGDVGVLSFRIGVALGGVIAFVHSVEIHPLDLVSERDRE